MNLIAQRATTKFDTSGKATSTETEFDRSYTNEFRPDERKIKSIYMDRDSLIYKSHTNSTLFSRSTESYEVSDLEAWKFTPWAASMLSDPQSVYYEQQFIDFNDSSQSNDFTVLSNDSMVIVFNGENVTETYHKTRKEQIFYGDDSARVMTIFSEIRQNSDTLFPAIVVRHRWQDLGMGGRGLRVEVAMTSNYRYGPETIDSENLIHQPETATKDRKFIASPNPAKDWLSILDDSSNYISGEYVMYSIHGQGHSERICK